MNQPCTDCPTLLLVDDDVTFCSVLSRALEKRNFAVTVANSVEQALPLAKANPPEYAVVDLKMEGASGLVLIQALHELDAATRIVVLTGYASIATAVEAVKLGAAVPRQARQRRRNRRRLRPQRQPGISAQRPARQRRTTGVGTHPARATGTARQHFRHRPPAQHAPPHFAAQAGKKAQCIPAIIAPRLTGRVMI
jgi:DNA-binding NtrC family response regulator